MKTFHKKLVLGISAIVLATAAIADTVRTYSLMIKSQPLDLALIQLAHQSGVQLAVHPQDVDGFVSPRIDGDYTLQAALQEMLVGTPLRFELVNPNTVAIRLKVNSTSSNVIPKGISQPSSTRPAALPRLAAVSPSESTVPSRAAEEVDQENEASSSGAIPEMLVRESKILNMDIRRTRDDVKPYVIFDRETIQRSGATNLNEFFRQRLPMNSTLDTLSQLAGSSANRSRINLRGLGTNQTLILIDGRRAALSVLNGTPEQTDVNGIPLEAIERIEVLSATSSASFGGGATGGAINIVLRKDYTGIETKLTLSNTVDSGGDGYDVSATGGLDFNAGATQVFFAMRHAELDRVTYGDRDFLPAYRARSFATAPSFYLLTTPIVGATPNIRSLDGSNLVLKSGNVALNSPFTFVPYNYSGTASDAGAGLVQNAGQYNFELARSAQLDGGENSTLWGGDKSNSLILSLRQRLTSNIQVYAEGDVSKNTTTFTNAANSTAFTVSSTAPNNPFQQSLWVTLPFSAADWTFRPSNENLRALGGVIVELPRQWSAGADVSWSRFRSKLVNGPGIDSGTLAPLIDDGSVDVLRDLVAAPIDFSPYNTAADIQTPDSSVTKNAVVRLAGPIGNLPAGSPTAALLLERVESDFDASEYKASTATLLFPSSSQSTNSASVEATIPIVSEKNAVAGVNALEMQMSGRWDDVTTRGSPSLIFVPIGSPLPSIDRASNEETAFSYTVGFRYQPVVDVTLRSSYGTGFIPPGVRQLTATTSQVNGAFLLDPRRGNEPVGIYTSIGGGNAGLEPETSTTLSAGVIFTPRALQNLRLSLDWVRLKKDDNIAGFPGGSTYLLNNESRYSERVVRAAVAPGDPYGVGRITLLDTSLLNLSQATVEAYDLQVDYQVDTSRFGTFNLFAIGTRTTRSSKQVAETLPEVEYIGTSTSDTPLKLKLNGGVTWQLQSWAVGWNADYLSSYKVALASESPFAIMLQGNDGNVPSQIYHNAFIRYKTNHPSAWLANTEIQLQVDNIFNKRPPYDGTFFYRYYSPYGDPRMARYQLSLRKSFSIN